MIHSVLPEPFSSVVTARTSILRGPSLPHLGQRYMPVACARSSNCSRRDAQPQWTHTWTCIRGSWELLISMDTVMFSPCSTGLGGKDLLGIASDQVQGLSNPPANYCQRRQEKLRRKPSHGECLFGAMSLIWKRWSASTRSGLPPDAQASSTSGRDR